MDNAINDLKISLGEAFLPMVKNVADAVAGLTNAYNQGSTSIKLTLFLVRNLGMLFAASIIGIMSYKAAFAVLKTTIGATNATYMFGATVSVGQAITRIIGAVAVIGLITAAMIKAEIKTANFVDAVAQLRANFDELSAQEN